MRGCFNGAVVMLALFVSAAVYAAPPTVTSVPAPVPPAWTEFKASAGRQLILAVGDKAAKWTLADDGAQLTPDSAGKSAVFSADKPGSYKLLVTVGDETTRVVVVVGGVVPVPDPKPKPIDPVPVPVTSFRVIFVYESADTLTATQTGVLNSAALAEYLNANTTKEGGVAGWRRFDKDATAANDTPTIKALWTAVKPKITTVPCWVVEVNGKAEIIPFPASVADGLATLKKYNGGK